VSQNIELKKVEKKKKKFDIFRILYLFLIAGFCVATVLFTRYAAAYHANPPSIPYSEPEGLLPYYFTFIIYPPRIVRDAGIASLLFLITLYLCLDFLFFEKLKGWKRGVSVALSIVFIILGTEYVMAYYANLNPVMHRPHPTILWELSPNIMDINLGPHKIHSNSHGFRSPELPVKKPPGQYRVLVLGDSSAFGFLVKNDEAFGAILVKELRKKYPGKDIRLINAAVSGYTTYQAAQFMRERGWKFSPDLIIISFNDDPQMEWKQDVQRIPPKIIFPLYRLLYKSNIYLTLKKMILNASIRKDGRFARAPGRNDKQTNRVTGPQLKQNLAYILDGAKKRGAKAIIISMPLQTSAGITIEEYREIMKESALSRGNQFLDLLYEWKKYPQEEVFFDVMHPTAKGHQIIGRELFKIVVENGLVEK